MKTTIEFKRELIQVDLSKPIDISMPVVGNTSNPNAWYISHPVIEPVKVGEWTGKITEGASTNFNNIYFNPHAHGTHTECVGHITEEFYSINDCLKTFFFTAKLISVLPEEQDGDYLIKKKHIEEVLLKSHPEAIIIRTLPNTEEKLHKKYSHTNPPYLTEEAAIYLREIGVKHLLIDLPSVDKEKDQGKLLAHKAFWNFHGELRLDATITEFIYVKNEVADGDYLLNIQIASFENDASPSKPVLYEIVK